MIIEGIVTTVSADGTLNAAPMGPKLQPDFQTMLFRPFNTSVTFANLRTTRQGVFHLVDDVLLLAQCALGAASDLNLEIEPARKIHGSVLKNCARWFEFEVTSFEAPEPRAEIVTQTVWEERRSDLVGWNRAQFAVIEATILATRRHLLPHSEIQQRLTELRPLVEKTGSSREFAGWHYVCEKLREPTPDKKTP